MLKWERTGRVKNAEGVTITYAAAGTKYTIESRKRHIPHTQKPGTWDHTSYFVLQAGRMVLNEFTTMAKAKDYVERLAENDAMIKAGLGA